MASVVASRLLSLTKLRSEVFQTAFNPTSQRTGAKYLRARLRGPSMVKYYPEEVNVAKMKRMFKDAGLIDFKEAQRLEDIKDRRVRGKVKPKKAKTKADSRRTARKR
ncbi:hypothetical protein PLICRDRAFT_175606 [Plicaturopsis crispa FD-325 SS-3]|nr:hypothetical protein PLICRDRAFT_175606 [Plicaturopsis crispa FD-325 SS-3]